VYDGQGYGYCSQSIAVKVSTYFELGLLYECMQFNDILNVDKVVKVWGFEIPLQYCVGKTRVLERVLTGEKRGP